MKKSIFSILPVLVALSASGEINLTRHGITWTIAGTPESGNYANGDPWVVGPVTITAISPTPTAGRNGTVVNPVRGRTQGFDNRMSNYNTYSESLNVGNDLPLVVTSNTSVVSSISREASQSFEQIETYAILTVVTEPPGTGSFRPAYIGGDFAHPWSKEQLDFDALADMDRSRVSEPSIDTSEAIFDKVWYEQDLSWTGRYMHTNYMGGGNGYGRNMALDTGTAALLLNLDFSDSTKEDLLVKIVQYGIDIHGILENGGVWAADGGHNPGRLLPLFIAAMTLNDSNMKRNLDARVAMNFQEQQQTFYVSQADVNRNLSGPKPPYLNYTQSDIGMPEWGIRHSSSPKLDNKYWTAAYRDIGGGVLQAPAIIIKLMGGEDIVNWPALLDYAERHLYYREGRYTIPIYYNGYDNGDSYGNGDVEGGQASAPFSYNPMLGFHREFYLAFENIEPTGSIPDLIDPIISDVDVIETDTTAIITWNTDEGATSIIDWSIDSGVPYENTVTVAGFKRNHSVEITGLTKSTTYFYRVRSIDNSLNEASIPERSFTTEAFAVLDTPLPAFFPGSGDYWDSQSVTITAETSDSIRYTTNGLDPDDTANEYFQPIIVDQSRNSVRLKAIASAAGQNDSPVGVADYNFKSWDAIEGGWRNIVYPTTTTDFSETIYVKQSQNEASDLVIGFGVSADSYNDMAIMFRLVENGLVEARNGDSYTAENTLNWEVEVEYKIEIRDVSFGVSYDLIVTPEGGVPVVIANDYAWRTDWTGAGVIDSIGVYDSLGRGSVVSSRSFNESNNELISPDGLIITTN